MPLLPAVLSGAIALALGGWVARPVLFGMGRHAVRSFIWTADGSWRLKGPDQIWLSAELLPATATLGPWILLAWRAGGRRRYALIEVWEVGLPGFRLLRGRLKLAAGALRVASV